MPDWCPIQPQDCWTELPDANWNPLQRALLDGLPGERLEPRAFELPGVAMPRRLTSPRARATEGRAGDESTRVPDDARPSSRPAALRSRRSICFTPVAARRRSRKSFVGFWPPGVTLDQVEIACASDAHLALVWEKALRHNWPVTLGAGIPATFTRPGRALLGLCDWIETDFSAGHLRRLLQSGDMSVEEHEGFTAGQAARVLARAEAGWGRATYGLALGRLCKSYEARAADPDESDADRADAQEKAERAARVRAWITDLVASVPAARRRRHGSAADGRERRARLPRAQDRAQQCARSSGGGRAAGIHRRAPRARRVLVRAARGAAVRPGTCPVAHGRARASAPRSSLRVAPVAGRLCRPPAPLHRRPRRRSRVLVVHGRRRCCSTRNGRAISADLRLSTDRIDEAVYAVLSRLAVSGASATFSYSCRDTREFRETYASWLMLQAYRLQQGNEALSYQDDEDGARRAEIGRAGRPRRRALAQRLVAPRRRRHRTGRDSRPRRRVSADGARPCGRGAARGARVHRVRRLRARRRARCSTRARPTNVYSVTELEKAAECPFRFFLKRGLGVRPVDERERDKDVWLDPLTRGSELHDVYAALLRRTRDENRRPSEGRRCVAAARSHRHA